MSELRPCPSCDHVKPAIPRSVSSFDGAGNYTYSWYSFCPKCFTRGPDGVDKEQVIEDWNALPRRSDTNALRNELIGVLTQIKTSEIGGRYAGIGQRIDELVKEGTV